MGSKHLKFGCIDRGDGHVVNGKTIVYDESVIKSDN